MTQRQALIESKACLFDITVIDSKKFEPGGVNAVSERIKMVSMFYGAIDEESRLSRSRHGQMEYRTTMEFIHRYAAPGSRILEIGAGTGRYSIALAKEGYDVTAVELVEHNLEILRANSTDIPNLQSWQGDALNLAGIGDGEYDMTLILGPLYHLYDQADVHKAISEAVRVTKKNGLILAAFLSVDAILFNNYLNDLLLAGLEENFAADYTVRHFEKQLFTGYDIAEFERLFDGYAVEHLATAATDGILELAEGRNDFTMSDQAFEAYADYHLARCENRTLLGCSSHLLYVCRKK